MFNDKLDFSDLWERYFKILKRIIQKKKLKIIHYGPSCTVVWKIIFLLIIVYLFSICHNPIARNHSKKFDYHDMGFYGSPV